MGSKSTHEILLTILTLQAQLSQLQKALEHLKDQVEGIGSEFEPSE